MIRIRRVLSLKKEVYLITGIVFIQQRKINFVQQSKQKIDKNVLNKQSSYNKRYCEQKQKYLQERQQSKRVKFGKEKKMMKKNQMKRLSLQKLQQLSKETTNGEILALIRQVIQQRNDTVKEKAQELRKQLQRIRKQTRKTVNQMNDVVKDQLGKKEKIIMDKNSRPTHEDIKNLTQTFIFLEAQNQLIDRNNRNIDQLLAFKQEHQSQISSLLSEMNMDFSQLDKEHDRLKSECEKQQRTLNHKKQNLSKFKSHVDNIQKTIQQYRIKYQAVEDIIRERQRQLDHLVTYFKNRKQQDHQNIERERRLSQVIESELLKTQTLFNANNQKTQKLSIIQNQKLLQNL